MARRPRNPGAFSFSGDGDCSGPASELPPLAASLGTAISGVAASIDSRNATRSLRLLASASARLKFALPAFVWNCHAGFANRSSSVGAWPWCRYGAPSASPYSDGTL